MEYITSIRNGSLTVEELIKILQQFDSTATVWIAAYGQLDIYRLDDGDIDIL